MGNISYQRLKNLIIIAFIPIAIFSYFIFFTSPILTKENIGENLLKKIEKIEKKLEQKNIEYQKRSDQIYKLYQNHHLQHLDLKPKEALIIERDGVIIEYFGEIFYYKILPIEIGDWVFIEKSKNIYFVRKMDEHIFYVKFYCHLENNSFLQPISFALREIKFQTPPLGAENQFDYDSSYQLISIYQYLLDLIWKSADHFYSGYFLSYPKNIRLLQLINWIPTLNLYIINPFDKYIYDNIKNYISYDHLLNHTNNQFLLQVKVSLEEVKNYYKKKEKSFLILIIGLFLIILMFYFYQEKPLLIKGLWLIFLIDLFIFISVITPDHNNFLLNLKIFKISLEIFSLLQISLISLFLLSILYLLKFYLKNRVISIIFFNITAILINIFFDYLFKGIQFNYMMFNWNQILLIIALFLLHLIPLSFVFPFSCQVNQSSREKQKFWLVMIFISIQIFIIFLVKIKYNLPLTGIILFSVLGFLLIFLKRSFLSSLVLIFLLAISIYQQMSNHSLKEKMDFVENNVQKIFLNQGNYAKFIAREIVHEINLNRNALNNYYDFFNKDTSSILNSIWRKTIAYREDIASGIFVISKKNELISHFSYQIPLFEVQLSNEFPVWAVEDTTAEIQGRKIPLVTAYISIYRQGEYLGRILVLVYNSPELLLKFHENVNILKLNKKINGEDFSYIKLNEENQIIENPSNVNLQNISGLLSQNDQWIKFQAFDMNFKGYIFNQGVNVIIIFFPKNTIFKTISGIIKIFLLISVIVLLLRIKHLKHINWYSIYYSFSIRVFAFLILISLLTAIIFSVFFINFSAKTSEQKILRMMYERGRSAQNIGYFIQKNKDDELTRDQLFSISNILNGDINVYGERGELNITYNYRKFIKAQIPEYLNSHILTLLNKKNQKLEITEDVRSFRLYYKIYDKIYVTELSNKWEEVLSEKRYYTDFIITLFFIMIIIGFFTAFFFRNKILSPIDGLNQGMAEVERGNLNKLTDIPAELEIKNLYKGFNSMIEGIREQKRAISEVSRMKTIIRLGRQVAHEVKNPLTPIKLSAEQILKAMTDKNDNYEEIITQSVNYIIDETEHLKRVSYGFLDLSRLEEINREIFDLVDLVKEELFTVIQVYSNINFSYSYNENAPLSEIKNIKPLMVSLDKIKIKQVLKNLINNSIDAIGEKGGEIKINLKKDTSQQRIIIEVSDNGMGMDEIEFNRAFEVNYSTKEIGTGLGLFIVKRIVELHKGNIEINSQKNKGTTVILDLPLNVPHKNE